MSKSDTNICANCKHWIVVAKTKDEVAMKSHGYGNCLLSNFQYPNAHYHNKDHSCGKFQTI